MSVKTSETGNFFLDLRKMLNQGKRPKLFITLFENQVDFSLVTRVLGILKYTIEGIVVDEVLINCRDVSVHDKIKDINESCGYKKYTIDEIRLLENTGEEIIVIVKNKYTYLKKIVNIFETANVNCILYHISDLKHNIAQIDSENNHLPIEANCSGCGACVNICPVQAIEMKYSSTNFLIPMIDKSKCINCNLCTNTCPSLNPVFKNKKEPKFYSFCASDAIRKESSSGGMFTVLSEYVLVRDGYICGAAFDENMKLNHIIVNNKNDLMRLKGSKYVQSNMGTCYQEIKKLLNDNQWVLFTGTPCQVAGMKAFLKKEYDTLITAEVLCHGVPSQKFFDSYIEEISREQGKKIKNAEFRSKRFGWAFSGMIFHFDDDTEYINRRKGVPKNIYLDAFIDNMMMRDMCYDCVFNDYSRQADFTIGDLWHSDKLDPKSNDKKGTSFVFVNNEKAEKIYSVIASEAKYHKLLPVKDYSKIPNRVTPKTKVSPLRERFLALLKEKSFSEAYHYAVNGYYDIGLPSVLYNDNIGSVLTYYALYYVLSDLNYSVLPIERPLDAALKISEEAREFNRKWLPSYAQAVQYNNILEMRELNRKCGQFVLGSDQIFLESMSECRNHFFFLQWVEENKERMGYASSFGGAGARGSKEYYRELTYYLNKFKFLSCRENDGVNLANNELKLDYEVKWCIDPVFLCDKKYYMRLIESTNKKRESEYIGSYVIKPRSTINKLISKTIEHFNGLPVEVLGSIEKVSQVKEFTYPCIEPFPIENALELIYNSKYFVTDSFHGVCFAIIFKKDFLVIPRDFIDRFTTLLEKIGLGDRIINNNLSNFTPELYNPIDYDKVYQKLEKEIEESKKLLIDALNIGELDTILSDVDIVMNYIEENSKKIEDLLEEDSENKKLLENILERLVKIENKINKLEMS